MTSSVKTESGAQIAGLEPITRGFAYFGEPGKREPRRNFYNYHNKPATRLDFGLSPEEEQRADALHQTLYVFDTALGSCYFDGLHELMHDGKGSGIGCSATLGGGIDLFNGLDDNLEIKRTDWGARPTLDRDLEFMERMQAVHGDKMMICMDSADLFRAQELGKIAYMLDVQDISYFGNDLNLLDYYYERGLRRVQLTYNRQTLAASGCMEPTDAGVSLFGAEMIGRMNELNMMVDTAHSSSLTLSEAIDISTQPISCSHAGLRSMVPSNPRSFTDEDLSKLADNGGVFGVLGVPGTLTGESDASVTDFCDAIDRAVNIMGVDAVGFSTDQTQSLSLTEISTHPDWPPEAIAQVNVSVWPFTDTFEGMENVSGYPNLTRGLVAKGYSDDDIRKIMGGNQIRLIQEVIG